MESKIHRYMQRIERIMGTPNKTISPIRPSKSPLNCKTNQLDLYLKYELSGKIVRSIIQKNHNHYVTLFFNCLRNSEYRQKERIYKFVAIQKKDTNSAMRVDKSISGKIMVAVLKQIMKKRLIKYFQKIVYQGRSEITPFQKQTSTKKGNNGKQTNFVETNKSSKLIRTSSRPEHSNYKEVTEWQDDVSSLMERQNLMKQLSSLKLYTLKSMLKVIVMAVKKHKDKGFRAINNWGWAKIRKDLVADSAQLSIKNDQYLKDLKKHMEIENSYKNQIETLANKLIKSNQITNTIASTTKFDSKITKFQQEQNLQMLSNNNNFVFLVQKLNLKRKTHFISQCSLALKNSVQILKIQQPDFRLYNYTSGLFLLVKIANKLQRSFITQLRQQYNHYLLEEKEKQVNYLSYKVVHFSNILTKFIDKSLFKHNHLFFNNIISQLQPKQIIKDHSQSNINATQAQKPNNSEIINTSKMQHSSIVVKDNFYSFVDKIFKLILIVSKLLIPIKQAFRRIDNYACYSFRVEQSLKIIPLRQQKIAFDLIKQYVQQAHSLSITQQSLKNMVSIIDIGIRQRYVQAFSHIKILSKQKELKIKILPVRYNIVQVTKKFLTDRNDYNQQTYQTWSKLKLELEQNNGQTGNPEKQMDNQKRSKLKSTR